MDNLDDRVYVVLRKYNSAYNVYLVVTTQDKYGSDFKFELFLAALVMYKKRNNRIIKVIETNKLTWNELITFLITNVVNTLKKEQLTNEEDLISLHITEAYYSEFLEWMEICGNNLIQLVYKHNLEITTNHDHDKIILQYLYVLSEYLLSTQWHHRLYNKTYSEEQDAQTYHTYRFELFALLRALQLLKVFCIDKNNKGINHERHK